MSSLSNPFSRCLHAALAVLMLWTGQVHAADPPIEYHQMTPGPWKYRAWTQYYTSEWYPEESTPIDENIAYWKHWWVCNVPPRWSRKGDWKPDGWFGTTEKQYRDDMFWFTTGAPNCGDSGYDNGLRVQRERTFSCNPGSYWYSPAGACYRPTDPTKNCNDEPQECSVSSGGGGGGGPLGGGPTIDIKVADPVHSRTGESLQIQRDFVSPASRLLNFSRYYRSGTHVAETELGPQWRHSFSRRLSINQNTSLAITAVVALRHDASRYIFVPDGSGGFRSDADVISKLKRIDGVDGTLLGWQLTTGGDSVEIYAPDGTLLSIETRDGDRVDLRYEKERLSEVEDRQGRKLRFTYFKTSEVVIPRRYRLSEVELPDGNKLRYEYNGGYYLAKVLQPDATPGDTSDNPRREYVYGEGPNGTAARLTGLIDENGNRFVTWRFDSTGRVILSVQGNETSYVDRVELSYVSANRTAVKSYTSPTTSVTRNYDFTSLNYTWLGSGQDQPCPGCAKSITYDANGNRDLVTDFAGVVTDYDYNSRNLETRRIEAKAKGANTNLPERRTTETDWHATFRLPVERRVKNAAGTLESRTTYAYNSRGQMTSISQVDPASSATRTTTYAYCEQTDVDTTGSTCPLLGLRKSIDGPRTDVSDVSMFAYFAANDESGCDSGGVCYRKGDLNTITNALGHQTKFLRYDRTGRVRRMQDANGVVTDIEYDARGRVVARIVRGQDSATELDDAITRMAYDGADQVTEVTQPDGAFIAYTYDAAHRLTDITDNLGNTIHYTLDGVGNRIQEDTKDPSGALKRRQARAYDLLSNLQAVKNAAGIATSTRTFDASYNVDKTTDALGRVADSDYDALNRLIKMIQDQGAGRINATTQYAYDARDNLRQVTDPKALNTVYTYDGLNNVTQLSSPDTGATTYTHDSAGNRTTQTDARGVTTAYTHDALNRLTAMRYPNSSLDVLFTYDAVFSACGPQEAFAKGRLTRIVDHSGETLYCYDRRGYVVRKIQTVMSNSTDGEFVIGGLYEPVTHETRYAYTLAGSLSSITYPDGSVVSYTRDTLGRIASVQRNGQSLVTSAQYLPFGPLSQIEFANGDALTRSYDANYWPTGVASNAIQQHYSLDALGNITALGDTPGVPAAIETYTYDALDRLKEIRDANLSLIEAYTYDATGNRASKMRSGATQSYGYDPLSHRLTGVGTQTRGYDANGNWITAATGPVHTFDERNRLVAADGASFDYNGKGERVLVDGRAFGYDENGKLLFEFGSAQQACQVCPPDTICEATPGDPTMSADVFNPAEGGPIEAPPECPEGSTYTTPGSRKLYVWMDDIPVAYVANGETFMVHADHLNTPRALTTNTAPGQSVWRWTFQGNAFGENAANPDPDGNGEPVNFGLRFPGQYDDGAGLHYNYFRDYDPGTGRYIESDPVGLIAGMSTYQYADSRPAVLSDWSGLITCNRGRSYNHATRQCEWNPGPNPLRPVCIPSPTCEQGCEEKWESCRMRTHMQGPTFTLLAIGTAYRAPACATVLAGVGYYLDKKESAFYDKCDRDAKDCRNNCAPMCLVK